MASLHFKKVCDEVEIYTERDKNEIIKIYTEKIIFPACFKPLQNNKFRLDAMQSYVVEKLLYFYFVKCS